ncbi:MAG TPA: RNA polymerase factor sigma-54 [Chromatiaceae bacterium]|nr:RNA polymerase factor sigma-54 [Chromatiaceae bacterium]
MKLSLQLKLGQQLTMTPQLQQAIRLLQLSAVDLQQEVQDALDSNPMLESEEENKPPEVETVSLESLDSETIKNNSETELNVGDEKLPDELPTDSNWEDTFEASTPTVSLPSGGNTASDSDYDIFAQSSAAQTLHDHLMWQLNLTPFSEQDQAIATTIIDAVDESGYLRQTSEEMLDSLNADIDDEEERVSEEEFATVLHRIQHFDPPGVAAQGPRDCLLIQLRQLAEYTPWRELAIRIVSEGFEQLVKRDIVLLRRKLKVDDGDLKQAIALIQTLNPRPGSLITDAQPEYIVPDVIVRKQDGEWTAELNPEALPKVRVNNDYAALVKRSDDSKDNNYLKNHLQEARWFLKSLQSRHDTLLNVARTIVELQRNFFEYGEEAMKPLVLRDIATRLEMHESTISRSTMQKYMLTPRGTFEFKYFFSSHVDTDAGGECSATAIRALIKKLIAAEKPGKPLSDNKIATMLSEQGIKVARRTVAKYRESMAIPPSNERRRIA